MSRRAPIAALVLPALALGLAGCASGHRAAGSAPVTSASIGTATSASAGPSDSDAGQFADPSPAASGLAGRPQACALVADLVRELQAGSLNQFESTLPQLLAATYGLRNDPASAGLVRDTNRAIQQLADPSVIQRAWSQYDAVSKLPAMPQLTADCHQ